MKLKHYVNSVNVTKKLLLKLIELINIKVIMFRLCLIYENTSRCIIFKQIAIHVYVTCYHVIIKFSSIIYGKRA